MTGSKQKSEAEVTRLANMVQADNFDPHDLRGFNAHTEMKHFDRSESALDESNPLQQDGWRESSVNILIPTQERNPDGNGWHCKQELIHGVWKILLDNEFLDAYRNGIVVKCFDGKLRRLFPRIFTYSADYPEKYVQV